MLGIYAPYKWFITLPKYDVTFDSSVEINAETGEMLFWGKGRCHVCHRVGERGYAKRGPNLGKGKDGEMISPRAEQRATALNLKNGVQYLVQSIADPGAFVVPGYSNEMPEVFKPPIVLSPSEIKAVVLYLATLEGDSITTQIELPARLLDSYAFSEKEEQGVIGDADEGRRLFFDLTSSAACAECHTAFNHLGELEGDPLGPDLSNLASIRSSKQIYNKIIQPYSYIVSGYQEVLVQTKNGLFLTGVIDNEDDEKLILIDRKKSPIVIMKKDIQSRHAQTISMMPSNYGDLLTEKQLADLLAFLMTQKTD